jgi:formylglycine-generating enzyme required for sulfatase activity
MLRPTAVPLLLVAAISCSGARTGLDPLSEPQGDVDASLPDAGGDAGPDCEDLCRCNVWVPEGPFTMGTDRLDCTDVPPCDRIWHPCAYQPAHEVFESGFFIGHFEATVGCYNACVEEGACDPVQQWDSSWPPPEYWTDPANSERPAYGLRRSDATSYCERLGARLPTEAEWEKAARGTDARTFPWGDTPPTCEDADLGHGGHDTDQCPVDGDGSIPLVVTARPRDESPYGVRGMAGGVREWVADGFDPAYYETATEWTDPTGPQACPCELCPDGVQRGSHFHSAIGGPAREERNAAWTRIPEDPAIGSYTGVRCVWEDR